MLRLGKHRRTPLLDFAWLPNERGHPRIGLVIPRHGATIVQRNRLRRRLRELARRQLLPHLTSMDLVIRSRSRAYNADFHRLAAEFGGWQDWLRT